MRASLIGQLPCSVSCRALAAYQPEGIASNTRDNVHDPRTVCMLIAVVLWKTALTRIFGSNTDAFNFRRLCRAPGKYSVVIRSVDWLSAGALKDRGSLPGVKSTYLLYYKPLIPARRQICPRGTPLKDHLLFLRSSSNPRVT
jgi:hypothetical protein